LKKIKVGIVNYLNTAPLIYGLKNSPVMNDIELMPDYPSNLARDLVNGTIDVGLVPVAVIPELKNYWLVGDYCIGSDGAVASVCIFSEVPVHEIKKVLLDYQSRTSVELAKILLKDFWKIDVEFVDAKNDFEKQISGTTAGVVIGDRSLLQRKISPYIYDLGEAWKNHTGLPFVFAAWVSNKQLDDDFVKAFNDANAYGVQHIKEVITTLNTDLVNLDEYFSLYISYQLDERKRKGLELFLGHLNNS
jgi:chorismate dehydratase